MNPPALTRVLCPKCVQPGGLRIFTEYISSMVSLSNTIPSRAGQLRLQVCQVPVLSCSLRDCGLILVGRMDGGIAVFPDPHVQAEGR